MLSPSVWQDTVNIHTICSISCRGEKGKLFIYSWITSKLIGKKSQISSVISDTMIFIKERKSLLNDGETGERFYFRSWGKDPCIKIIQLSRADISVQNNSPIAVFIFCRMHSLSVSFILKGPVVPSVSYIQPHERCVCLCLFSNLVESRRQDGRRCFRFKMETAVCLACCKAVVLFSRITQNILESMKFLFWKQANSMSQTNHFISMVSFRTCPLRGRKSDGLGFPKWRRDTPS